MASFPRDTPASANDIGGASVPDTDEGTLLDNTPPGEDIAGADLSKGTASAGATDTSLPGTSRADLARGFSTLEEPDPPDPFNDDTGTESLELSEPKANQPWTEDEGGFLKRPHGMER